MLSGVLQEYFLNLLRNKQLKTSTIVKLTELKRPTLWLHPEKSASLGYTGFLT